jgi:hypothetical protein
MQKLNFNYNHRTLSFPDTFTVSKEWDKVKKVNMLFQGLDPLNRNVEQAPLWENRFPIYKLNLWNKTLI